MSLGFRRFVVSCSGRTGPRTRHISEDFILQQYRCENLRFHTKLTNILPLEGRRTTLFMLKFSKNLWIHRFCLTNSPVTCSEAWSCLRSCTVLVNRCSLPQFMFGSQNNLHSHSLIWPNPHREACLCNESVVLHFPVHTFSNISILAFFWVHSTTDRELCPH